MRAVILAAGRGSRLGAASDGRPKALVDLAGMPMLDHQITVLRRAGIDDVVVVTGFRADLLARTGITMRHNAAWAETNMVETLFCAEDLFGDDLIVAYGDIVYAPFVLDALVRSDHDVSVVVDRAWRNYWQARFEDPLSDAESLRFDGAGRITDIGNAVSEIDQIQGQYIGLMRFRGGGITTLRRVKSTLGHFARPWMESRPIAKAYMTDLLMEIILGGEAVHAIPVDGGWLEIDTPADLALALDAFAGRMPSRHIDAAVMAGQMP